MQSYSQLKKECTEKELKALISRVLKEKGEYVHLNPEDYTIPLEAFEKEAKRSLGTYWEQELVKAYKRYTPL